MRHIGYALVNDKGEIKQTTGSLPWSPAPEDNPLGRIATFDAVGQSADGLTVVEMHETEPAHSEQVSGAPTTSFDSKIVVVDLKYTDAPLAEAKARAILNIKEAANTIILKRFPMFKQSNMIARQGELHRIESGLMRDENGGLMSGRSLTQTEIGELVYIAKAWAWIKAVRSRSDTLEAEVSSLTDAASIAAFAITGWPE